MTTPQDVAQDWGMAFNVLVCEQCDWAYLSSESAGADCPNCYAGTLQPVNENLENLPVIAPPERLIPFAVHPTQLAGITSRFLSDVPYPPPDMNPTALARRAQAVFLPMWLVDAAVRADWTAQVGYNYQVESHKSTYQAGQWRSQRVYETRFDWEDRAGHLKREYENVSAPAIEDHQRLMEALGGYRQQSEAYTVDALRTTFVRLPDRPTTDALPDATEAFRQHAADEVRQAAEADRIRDFKWRVQLREQHWTQLLLPAYITHYVDDRGQPRRILMNGVTGHITGERRASMRRARRHTLIGVVIGIVIMLSALIAFTVDARLSQLAVGIALVGGIIAAGSLWPVLTVWRFNERETAGH